MAKVTNKKVADTLDSVMAADTKANLEDEEIEESPTSTISKEDKENEEIRKGFTDLSNSIERAILSQPKSAKAEANANRVRANEYVKNANRIFKEKWDNAPKEKIVLSSAMGTFLGKKYTFSYNGFMIVLIFDDRTVEYPDFFVRHLRKKFNAVMNSCTPIVKTTTTGGDTTE